MLILSIVFCFLFFYSVICCRTEGVETNTLMSDDNVAASSKNVKGIEVIPAGQAIDVADDISPPLSRSRRKSWATDTKTITLTTTVGYFSFFTPRHYL